MILGLGTDIAEISRMAEVYESTGDGLLERILTESELADLPKNPERQAAFLAKRFAAKEAAAKALGTGIAAGVSFQDFCVAHDEQGAPVLKVTGQAATVANSRGIRHWHISISDEQHYAIATVIAES